MSGDLMWQFAAEHVGVLARELVAMRAKGQHGGFPRGGAIAQLAVVAVSDTSERCGPDFQIDLTEEMSTAMHVAIAASIDSAASPRGSAEQIESGRQEDRNHIAQAVAAGVNGEAVPAEWLAEAHGVGREIGRLMVENDRLKRELAELKGGADA